MKVVLLTDILFKVADKHNLTINQVEEIYKSQAKTTEMSFKASVEDGIPRTIKWSKLGSFRTTAHRLKLYKDKVLTNNKKNANNG